jgi:hypothetical protein
MNHYINLLEPSEVTYLSSATTNPLYKLAAVGVGVVILGMFGLSYQSLRSTIQEGERIESTWSAIEEDVAKASELNLEMMRLDKGRQTLEGWSPSRHDWTEVMDYIINQAPGSLDDIQFTRFSFDEQMTGLRQQRPGPTANFHPLKRTITITIRGIIQTKGPVRMLTQFQRNLLTGETQPSPIDSVILDKYVPLPSRDDSPRDLTEFTFFVKLQDREVVP